MHARYGAMKVLCTGLVECGGGFGSKFKSSGHPHARPKNRSPSPARSTWHAAHNAKRPARPTNQYVWHSIWRYPTKRLRCQSNSRKTSWTHLFEIISNVFGGSALGQASMKAMQCLPLVWACLAIKEAGKKERRRGATRKSRFLASSSCATKQSRHLPVLFTAAAAAATATSSDWLLQLQLPQQPLLTGCRCFYLVIHVHIWCGVRRVGLARVIVYCRLYGLCDPREQFMILPNPEPVFFPPCNFLLPHLQCKKFANFCSRSRDYCRK